MATFPERGDALRAFTEFGESLIELLERVRGTGTGEAVGEKTFDPVIWVNAYRLLGKCYNRPTSIIFCK